MSDLRKSMATARPSVFLPVPSSRPSVYTSNTTAGARPSVALGGGGAGGSGSTLGTSVSTSFSEKRWASKQAELQGLLALENQAAKLVAEIKSLDERVGEIVDGTETFASVMASWQGVFRAIQISRADLATLSTDTADLLVHSAAASEVEAQAAGGEKEATTGTAGEVPEEEDPLATLNEEQVKVQTLVRIPVDDEGASVATDPQVGDAATASAQT